MMGDTEALRDEAHRLDGPGLDRLVGRLAGARLVLLGEASHGTHEFYDLRAELSRRLIRDHGFAAVAVEADWPDAYRVNRYVRGRSDDADADAALAGFQRFPTWMWRNTDVLAFVEWLREHDAALPEDDRAGFYGLDLYSLYASIEAVTTYLERVDPDAARDARERYGCLEQFGEDAQAYGYAALTGVAASCEEDVVEQLRELQRKVERYARMDGRVAEDEAFFAEQNARLVLAAERYYRAMYRGGAPSWNLRDRHMADTLDALLAHLAGRRPEPKVVVWEHNSHIGDARATEVSSYGELNVGQLVRERHGDAAVLVGFTTFTGTITAASDWGGTAERRWVRPALRGSHEELLHRAGPGRSWLDLSGGGAAEALRAARLERAIGVIYRPETERASHYVRARMADQFDVVVHVDETIAVEPLEIGPGWETAEPPETYPSAV